MTLYHYIPICAGLILLIWYIVEKLKAYSMKALFIKIVVSLCFLATALISLVVGNASVRIAAVYCVLIVFGQILGLLGDVVLDLKYIDREREELYTKSGFLYFGFGHIAFMIAMFCLCGHNINQGVLVLIGSLVLGFVLGFITAKMGPVFGNHYGDYFGTVSLYCGMLASAVVYAVLNTIILRNKCMLFMAIGLVLFLASDLILSRTYFGENHHKPVDIIPNYITYYGGQFMIALSAAFAAGIVM